MTVTYSTRFGGGFVADSMFQGMVFPAGEAHVKLLADKERKNVGPLTQIARVHSPDGNDLFEVAMWANACLGRGEQTILHIPYLPGARADHSEEMVHGAQVYADFINSLYIDKVVVFDPHSPIMPGMINNIQVINSTRLIRQHIVGHADRDNKAQRYQGIIAPDKGAVERATHVALATHLPLYRAEKHRDPDTGKLSGFTCESLPDEGKFLVVDDICDGGGTFMGLAEATGVSRDRLGLYVSHGVFSGNAYHLWEHFSEIWTTDSLETANNINRPTFWNERGRKFEQYHDFNVNVINLHQTLNGYVS